MRNDSQRLYRKASVHPRLTSWLKASLTRLFERRYNV
jgi:hypothetical protein